jgi:hypothetical protein
VILDDATKADIAKAVRSVHFAFGPGGTCATGSRPACSH